MREELVEIFNPICNDDTNELIKNFFYFIIKVSLEWIYYWWIIMIKNYSNKLKIFLIIY